MSQEVKKLSEHWGVTERAINTMKQKHPKKYELIELGSICVDNNLSKEDLIDLIQLKELIKKIK